MKIMKRLIAGPKMGELNGGWAFLLKVMLILIVPGIGYHIWMAGTLIKLETCGEYRQKAIESVEDTIKKIEDRIAAIEKRNP